MLLLVVAALRSCSASTLCRRRRISKPLLLFRCPFSSSPGCGGGGPCSSSSPSKTTGSGLPSTGSGLPSTELGLPITGSGVSVLVARLLRGEGDKKKREMGEGSVGGRGDRSAASEVAGARRGEGERRRGELDGEDTGRGARWRRYGSVLGGRRQRSTSCRGRRSSSVKNRGGGVAKFPSRQDFRYRGLLN